MHVCMYVGQLLFLDSATDKSLLLKNKFLQSVCFHHATDYCFRVALLEGGLKQRC